MKTKSYIIWPEQKMNNLEAISFFENAGYVQGKDFKLLYSKILGRLVIKPLNQMILAQDALKLGFEKVTI